MTTQTQRFFVKFVDIPQELEVAHKLFIKVWKAARNPEEWIVDTVQFGKLKVSSCRMEVIREDEGYKDASPTS